MDHAQNLTGYPNVVFIGAAMEWLLGDEDVWLGTLSIGSKGP
jgi:hypothetical protein